MSGPSPKEEALTKSLLEELRKQNTYESEEEAKLRWVQSSLRSRVACDTRCCITSNNCEADYAYRSYPCHLGYLNRD